MRQPDLSISVIVCAYSDERKLQLKMALDSVLNQSRPALEIIAIIDHNPKLQDEIAKAYPQLRVIGNVGARGLSAARNTGLAIAKGDVIAFLDDDAIADRDWLSRMAEHYASPSIMGFGGGVIPMWPGRRPRWLPEEFNWVVGCSYRGQPEEVAPVRNPIGCNMSFRRELFERIGGFQEGIGREGADAAGCEETEFCIRAHQAYPNAVIVYDPQAKVHHQVTADRTQWKYFRKRCLAEGRSKTRVVKNVGVGDGLSSERKYLTAVLPAGILKGIYDTLVGFDPWGLARAAGIVAGTGYTAAGYFGAKLRAEKRAQ